MFVPKLNKNNFVRKRQQANRLFHIRDNNDFLWKISQSEQKMEKHHYFDDGVTIMTIACRYLKFLLVTKILSSNNLITEMK